MDKKSYFILFLFFSIQFFFAQNDFESKLPEPLNQKSYEELKDLFYEIKEKDTNQAEIYAEIYLQRAKSENDTIKIAKGYKYYRFISEDSLALKYADSIISITKNIDNKYYPALGYLSKGHILLYNIGNYKEALENYLKAQPYAITHNNITQQLSIKKAIGAIKSRWGDYEGALEIYRAYLNYIRQQKSYKSEYNKTYLTALYNLSISYINNKKLDSANIYIKEGITESLKVNDSLKYYLFVLIEGTRLYEKREYQKSLESFDKVMPFVKGIDLAICHLYKGKTYDKFKDAENSIFHLKKVDSFFQQSKEVYPDLADVYNILIKYSKNKNDFKNQLFYINRLLYTDSLIKNNYIHLNKTITDKYDIPLILTEKDQVIKELEKKESISSKLILILSVAGVVFLGLLLIYYLKQEKYKKRLKILLQEEQNEDVISENMLSKKKKEINIDENIINEILGKLKEFEENQEYTKQPLTISLLAKKFNTNSKYLSKVINTYKEKNFSNYINDLRITYVVKRLKKEKKIRKFTIKAIAEEIGFNTSEAFTNAFYKKTGIYPSYFLKELKIKKHEIHEFQQH